MATDVILSAFATPSQSNLNAAQLSNWKPSDVQPLDAFENRPKVIDVPKTGDGVNPPEAWGGVPFRRTADKMKQSGGGSIIQGMLRSYAAGIEPRRICLIGFSAGNSFLSAVLSNPADAELIDTVISLDGMTYAVLPGGKMIPESFSGWVTFARRAMGIDRMLAGISNPYLGPMMVVANTHIAPAAATVSSTKAASTAIWEQLDAEYWASRGGVPESVTTELGRRQDEIKARLAAAHDRLVPVSINCGNPASLKTWDSLRPATGLLGSCWTLDYGGNAGPDHCMIAYVAQRAIFDAFLVPRWNARSEAVAGLGGEPLVRMRSRLGQLDWMTPSEAQPGGGIVLPGSLNTGVSPLMAGVVGFASFLAGYALTR